MDGLANSVDSEQTAHQEQSDLGLHCLFYSVWPNTYFFGILHLSS